MKPYRVKGLNLELDESVQKICETSNTTSGSTRSVLYVLMLVCILAIISVINSYDWWIFSNWTNTRTQKNVRQIADTFQQMADDSGKRHSLYDSLATAFNLDIRKKRLDNNVRNEMENVHHVKVPFLGNSFDINDLGLIGGIAIFVLMLIARFTLNREASNLKIALKSITERYPDHANGKDFESYLDSEEAEAQKQGYSRTQLLACINYIRRQHHYNYLSMNEIFTLPPLEVTEGKESLTSGQRLVGWLFWFPALVYTLVLLNDLASLAEGWDISKANTVFLVVSEAYFLFLIILGSVKCTRLKDMIHALYVDFKTNEYCYNQ